MYDPGLFRSRRWVAYPDFADSPISKPEVNRKTKTGCLKGLQVRTEADWVDLCSLRLRGLICELGHVENRLCIDMGTD